MRHRREFLKTLAAGAAGTYATGHGLAQASSLVQAQRPRRRVTIDGRAVTVVDVHAHCVIPVEDILKGTPLDGSAAAAATTCSGRSGSRSWTSRASTSRRSRINGFWWYAGRSRSRRAESCAAQNEGLAKWVAAHPDRFVALASVALQHPELAAEQLEDGVKRLGLRGASIGGHVNGEDLSLPKYDPFWAKAAELGVLVFMHPGGAENIVKEGRAARPRRPRQHHRQSARDDVLPLAPDLRRHVRQVSGPARLRGARRRLPAVVPRPDRGRVRRPRQRQVRQQEGSRAST